MTADPTKELEEILLTYKGVVLYGEEGLSFHGAEMADKLLDWAKDYARDLEKQRRDRTVDLAQQIIDTNASTKRTNHQAIEVEHLARLILNAQKDDPNAFVHIPEWDAPKEGDSNN